MNRILVPLDGSPFTDQALPVAAQLARARQAEVVLLGVHPVPESEAQHREYAAEMAASLDRAAAHLADLAVQRRIVADNDPAHGILDAIAAERPDLVVMSTHGRSGWAKFVQGSVASEVMQNAGVPVALVHSTTAA
jgi:nucleotide-binding universal stress UspA family protein